MHRSTTAPAAGDSPEESVHWTRPGASAGGSSGHKPPHAHPLPRTIREDAHQPKIDLLALAKTKRGATAPPPAATPATSALATAGESVAASPSSSSVGVAAASGVSSSPGVPAAALSTGASTVNKSIATTNKPSKAKTDKANGHNQQPQQQQQQQQQQQAHANGVAKSSAKSKKESRSPSKPVAGTPSHSVGDVAPAAFDVSSEAAADSDSKSPPPPAAAEEVAWEVVSKRRPTPTGVQTKASHPPPSMNGTTTKGSKHPQAQASPVAAPPHQQQQSARPPRQFPPTKPGASPVSTSDSPSPDAVQPSGSPPASSPSAAAPSPSPKPAPARPFTGPPTRTCLYWQKGACKHMKQPEKCTFAHYEIPEKAEKKFPASAASAASAAASVSSSAPVAPVTIDPAAATANPLAPLGGWLSKDRLHRSAHSPLVALEVSNVPKQALKDGARTDLAMPPLRLRKEAKLYETTLLIYFPAHAGTSFASLLPPSAVASGASFTSGSSSASTGAAAAGANAALRCIRAVVDFLEVEHHVQDYHLCVEEARAACFNGEGELTERGKDAKGATGAGAAGGPKDAESDVLQARAWLQNTSNWHFKVLVGGVHADPPPKERCISCLTPEDTSANGSTATGSSLIEVTPENNIWLDAKGRAIVIVTPHSHVERMTDLADDHLLAMYRDAYTLLRAAEQYVFEQGGLPAPPAHAAKATPSFADAVRTSKVAVSPGGPVRPAFAYTTLVINQGVFRNERHLHLKAKITPRVWAVLSTPTAPATITGGASTSSSAASSAAAAAARSALPFFPAKYPAQVKWVAETRTNPTLSKKSHQQMQKEQQQDATAKKQQQQDAPAKAAPKQQSTPAKSSHPPQQAQPSAASDHPPMSSPPPVTESNAPSAAPASAAPAVSAIAPEAASASAEDVPASSAAVPPQQDAFAESSMAVATAEPTPSADGEPVVDLASTANDESASQVALDGSVPTDEESVAAAQSQLHGIHLQPQPDGPLGHGAVPSLMPPTQMTPQQQAYLFSFMNPQQQQQQQQQPPPVPMYPQSYGMPSMLPPNQQMAAAWQQFQLQQLQLLMQNQAAAAAAVGYGQGMPQGFQPDFTQMTPAAIYAWQQQQQQQQAALLLQLQLQSGYFPPAAGMMPPGPYFPHHMAMPTQDYNGYQQQPQQYSHNGGGGGNAHGGHGGRGHRSHQNRHHHQQQQHHPNQHHQQPHQQPPYSQHQVNQPPQQQQQATATNPPQPPSNSHPSSSPSSSAQ